MQGPDDPPAKPYQPGDGSWQDAYHRDPKVRERYFEDREWHDMYGWIPKRR